MFHVLFTVLYYLSFMTLQSAIPLCTTSDIWNLSPLSKVTLFFLLGISTSGYNSREVRLLLAGKMFMLRNGKSQVKRCPASSLSLSLSLALTSSMLLPSVAYLVTLLSVAWSVLLHPVASWPLLLSALQYHHALSHFPQTQAWSPVSRSMLTLTLACSDQVPLRQRL